MKTPTAQKIVIIGCGNVAWHIASHLHSMKKYSLFVYNHKDNPALKAFRSVLKCKTQPGLKNIIGDAEYYFVCVPDKAISSAAQHIDVKKPGALILHTSGSAELKELGKRVNSTGVFYPLQTFSRRDLINWREVPIIIEPENAYSENKMHALASEFSRTVVTMNYKDRVTMHLAAVLVNNFTNALYAAAADLIAKKDRRGNNFRLLLPLIKQTGAKLDKMDPIEAQTGPARRRDKMVLKKQQLLLSEKPELKKIYKQMSKLIEKQQKKQRSS